MKNWIFGYWGSPMLFLDKPQQLSRTVAPRLAVCSRCPEHPDESHALFEVLKSSTFLVKITHFYAGELPRNCDVLPWI